MESFAQLGAIPPQVLADGYIARVVHGNELTMAVVEIEANAALPEHEHVNEQFGMVITGSVTFRVGEETRDLEPGGIWIIPPNTPHTVTAGDKGAVVLDVFSPPRDWGALEQLDVKPPLWP